MSTAAPRNNSSTCDSFVPRPPTKAIALTLAFLIKRNRFVHTSTTWVANSRVGTQNIPLGADARPSPPLTSPTPFSLSSFLARLICATAGNI